MEEITFIQLSKSELTNLISSTINKALENQKPVGKSNDPLIKIKEVCKLLCVTSVTIHKWKREGKIPYHRISNRIFFKKSEILAVLRMSQKGR